MEKYIGVKEILAEPMTLGVYNEYRGWNMPENENPKKEGYLVEYLDSPSPDMPHGHANYISWAPKDVFDKSYRKTSGMTFGLAIEAMNKGYCVARKGWEGKNLFVYKQIPSVIDSAVIPKMQSIQKQAKIFLLNKSKEPIRYENEMILVKNTDGTRILNSWVASSSDTFAEDWKII